MSVDWKELMILCRLLYEAFRGTHTSFVSIPSCTPLSCMFSRLDIVSIRFLSVRHQLGGSIPIVANGQPLNPENYRAKLMGKQGQLGMRLPPHFFNGITGETKGKALAVLTLDRKCKMGNGSNITETDYTEVGK